MPDILISGSNGTDGGINGLLGMKLMELMNVKKKGEGEAEKTGE